MEYEFKVYQMHVDEHDFWVAESRALKGCVGQGDTADDAIQELKSNEQEWLSTAKEFGIPIPEKIIKAEKTYSGKIALRVSPLVHEEAMELAKELGISLNQYINDALVTYNTTLKNKQAAKRICI